MSERIYPHQTHGARWLAEAPGRVKLLADEQGTGKSLQVIRAAAALGVDRVLILCPAVARINWTREWERWWTPPGLHRRKPWALVELADRPPDAGPVIASYDYARINLEALVASGPWDVLVLDEGHRVSGVDAGQTHAVLGKDGLIRCAARTWVLTGTPWRNHPADIWPLLHAAGRTAMGYREFVSRYCIARPAPIGGGIRIVGARKDTAQELHDLVYGTGFALRRLKADVAPELPPVTFEELVVEPSPVDPADTGLFAEYADPRRAGELEAILARQRAHLEAKLIACGGLPQAELEALQTLAKSVTTLHRWNGLQKVGAIVQLVSEELDRGDYSKLVIGTMYRDTTEFLRVGLAKYHAATIYGGTKPGRRQSRIDAFQTKPDRQVLITQIQAVGEAVTLTAAHHGLLVEQCWTPAVTAQWVARLHRKTQANSVTIRVASLPGSVDQRIERVLRRKAAEIAELNGDWRPGAGAFEAIEDDSGAAPPPGEGDIYR